ncbi:MAG: hypothetical protein RLO01_01840 [Thalassobaculaceae bacterium]
MTSITAGYTLPMNLQAGNSFQSSTGGVVRTIIDTAGRTKLWGLSIWGTGGGVVEVHMGASVLAGDVIFEIDTSVTNYGGGIGFFEGVVFPDGVGLFMRNVGAGQGFYYATTEVL